MDLNQEASRVLARLGAQAALPIDPLPPGWRLGNWSLDLPDLILAGVLLLCLVLVAYGVIRLRPRGEPAWDSRDDAATATAAGPAHLAQAEAFAEAGRYMEAMHELLLQCVAELRLQGGGRLDASLTSREILQRATLPAVGQDALAGIVARVEETYFGRLPADRLHWRDCRSRFDLIRDALAGHG